MATLPADHIAIACGGTGGHLFPGLAVAREFERAGLRPILLVSDKQIDRESTKDLVGMQVCATPAVGFSWKSPRRFAQRLLQSYRAGQSLFRTHSPRAVIAMGGFTSVGPIWAGRRLNVPCFLHESNAVPGRANRWIARHVETAFLGFEAAARRLPRCRTMVTGTPVRAEFSTGDPRSCRLALGLDPDRPVLLVMGGSQGAQGVNQLVLRALPSFASEFPELQYLHLCGTTDLATVRHAYSAARLSAVVEAFSTSMPVLLRAATVAVSRAGASSLAELAAVRLPAVLVPYPAATDNHQFLNASEYVASGAASLLAQSEGAHELFAAVRPLLRDPEQRSRMATALQRWDRPAAAAEICHSILATVSGGARNSRKESARPAVKRAESSQVNQAITI